MSPIGKCCGDLCACKLEGTSDSFKPIQIVGTGTSQDPFIITFLGLTVDNTANVVHLTVVDDDVDGYVLSAGFGPNAKLDALADVAASSPTTGQVLGWNGTNWVAVAPATASPGAVVSDDSLDGDGSGGDPLVVAYASGGLIELGTGGIQVTDELKQQLVRHFAVSAARSTADPSPDLNAVSMLDSAPGRQDYWDGSAWQPLVLITDVTGTEFLNLSGPYDGRPVQVLTKLFTGSTDVSGFLTLLTAGDLTGLAGVLSVQVTPMGGSNPYWFSVDPSSTVSVDAYVFSADPTGAVPVVSTSVSALVTAITY